MTAIHPVVILSARNLVELLRAKGLGTEAEVALWLKARFPKKLAVQ